MYILPKSSNAALIIKTIPRVPLKVRSTHSSDLVLCSSDLTASITATKRHSRPVTFRRLPEDRGLQARAGHVGLLPLLSGLLRAAPRSSLELGAGFGP